MDSLSKIDWKYGFEGRTLEDMTYHPILRPSARLVASVRDDLRERRRDRAARRDLERELATRRSHGEMTDLLTLINRDDSPAADELREVLLRQQLRQGLHRYAS
jgi:hypothetical protein